MTAPGPGVNARNLASKEVQDLPFITSSPACLVHTLAALDLRTEASPADLVALHEHRLFFLSDLEHSVRCRPVRRRGAWRADGTPSPVQERTAISAEASTEDSDSKAQWCGSRTTVTAERLQTPSNNAAGVFQVLETAAPGGTL